MSSCQPSLRDFKGKSADRVEVLSNLFPGMSSVPDELLDQNSAANVLVKGVESSLSLKLSKTPLIELLLTPFSIVVQFEDFKNPFPALERYREIFTCFNDDIQGTGAVILAGMVSAIKRTGIPAKNHRAVFFGAGSAGVGVAKQIVEFFQAEGLTPDDARRCFWLVDTKGLITNDRGDKLADHKVFFSRDDNDGKQYKSLADVVDLVKPTILMGLSTIGGVFTPEILTKMAEWNKNPIVFPLSNPSANSECTFEDAIKYTDGRVLFASGSPFPDFEYKGKVHIPGQGGCDPRL